MADSHCVAEEPPLASLLIHNDRFIESGLYKPLQQISREIRLLRICAPSRSTSISLALVNQHVSLNGPHPQYTALSYAGGSFAETVTISLNDIPFQVSPKLYTTLTALCQISDIEDTLLWIDQICINQFDLVEKSSQVRMMGEIYKKASRTLIYLDQISDPQAVCRLVNKIDEEAIALPDPLPKLFGTKDDREFSRVFRVHEIDHFFFMRMPKVLLDEAAAGIDCLFEVLSSSWWTRCWCQQEVVVSPSPVVLLGYQQLGWPRLLTALNLLFVYNSHEASRNAPPHLRQQIGSLINSSGFNRASDLLDLRLHWQEYKDTPLGHLLRFSRRLQSTDPRDRVYSLLGMTASGYGIVPDYSSVVDLRMASIDAVKKILIEDQNLQFLVDAVSEETDARSDLRLPSWVLDVTAPLNDEMFHLDFVNATKGLSAVFNLEEKLHNDRVVDVLCVKAIRLGVFHDHRVLDIEFHRGGEPPWDLLNKWWEFVQKNDASMMNTQSLSEENRHTEVLQDFCLAVTFGFVADSKVIYEHFSSTSSNSAPKSLDAARDLVRTRKRFRVLPCSWRLGYLPSHRATCTVPINTALGDEVYLIPGIQVPVVLRPLPGQAQGYTFVGRAYVPSYMDGVRATQELQDRTLKYETIDLF